MPDRWVLDEDFPEGHFVPLTSEEEAQRAQDEREGLARADADAVAEVNERAIRERLETALVTLGTPARWTALTAVEKVELLRRSEAGLIRLLLRQLDRDELG